MQGYTGRAREQGGTEPLGRGAAAVAGAAAADHLRGGCVSIVSASVSSRTAVVTSSNCRALVADLVSLEASVISRSAGLKSATGCGSATGGTATAAGAAAAAGAGGAAAAAAGG